ncbi:MAG: hypothetical protein ABJC19_08010 [Gemmatimonadota bacterium]
MSGHVFHPGHDDLHGITVVVTGASGRSYLGRWHEQGNRGVVMKNVAIHDPASAELPLDGWLAKQAKFGIASTEKMYIVPPEEFTEVRLFAG